WLPVVQAGHFKTLSCGFAGPGVPPPRRGGLDKVGACTRELVSWEFGVVWLTSGPVTRVDHSRSPWATGRAAKGITSCAPHVDLPVAGRPRSKVPETRSLGELRAGP